jgi:hypothetical protein
LFIGGIVTSQTGIGLTRRIIHASAVSTGSGEAVGYILIIKLLPSFAGPLASLSPIASTARRP